MLCHNKNIKGTSLVLSATSRRAFTLVEMLVSIALTLFIMVILSSAFTTGIQAFRNLKALGDMEDRLRSTSTIMRRDLGAYHFDGLRKLSDPNFWNATAGGGPPQQGFFRVAQLRPVDPATGQPAVDRSGQPTSLLWEGHDSEPQPNYSTRATTHILDFTCKLTGIGKDGFFSAVFPNSLNTSIINANAVLGLNINPYSPGQYDSRFVESAQSGSVYRSRWAEVAYFLRPAGATTGVQIRAGSNVPLYTLYRRQLVVIDPVGNLNNPTFTNSGLFTIPVPGPSGLGTYYQLSCSFPADKVDASGNATVPPYFNSPQDLTMPPRRFAMDLTRPAGIPRLQTQYPYLGESVYSPSPIDQQTATLVQENSAQYGGDVLLTDVISFEVKVLVAGAGNFQDLFEPNIPANANPSFGSAKVFDTWSSQQSYNTWATAGNQYSAPLQLNIQALKITVRIWDAKTQQSRQVSIIQEM